ncbi:MAG: T9SS type A sorting domain-containing protein [Bacteroidales bacterium]|nr:T9SS type A sorting domain-containing protein [Bacteroidales bacterium]
MDNRKDGYNCKRNIVEYNHKKIADMKKLIFIWTLLTIIIYGNVRSQEQFDNNSFETWNISSGLPKGWNTLSISVPFLEDYPLCNIEKDNSSIDGNYSVKLTPAPLPEMLTQLAEQFGMGEGLTDMVIPSVLTNAKVNLSMESLASLGDMFQGGGDMTETDATQLFSSFVNALSDGLVLPKGDVWVKNINGYYKFSPESMADNFMLAALIVSEEGNQRTVVGGGVYQESAASEEFTQFSIPVTYFSDGDELIFIAFVSSFSMDNSSATPLYLDKITIEYDGEDVANPVVLFAENADNWEVYPNPAVNKTFRLSTQKPQSVKIYNSVGVFVKEITSYNPQSEIKLDKSGVYFVLSGGKTAKITVE